MLHTAVSCGWLPARLNAEAIKSCLTREVRRRWKRIDSSAYNNPRTDVPDDYRRGNYEPQHALVRTHAPHHDDDGSDPASPAPAPAAAAAEPAAETPKAAAAAT